jgi:hypothetical protein
MVSQLIIWDLGMFCSSHGLDKYFYQLNAVDKLVNSIGEENVSKELEKSVIPKRWEEIKARINELRPIVNEIKIRYDDIRKKEENNKADTEKRIEYRKLSRQISPYEFDLYFIFIFLINLTPIVSKTIPAQAMQNQDLAKYNKVPFSKDKPSETHNEVASGNG